jgi:hypothetical protein
MDASWLALEEEPESDLSPVVAADNWKDRLRQFLLQESVVESNLSLAGIDGAARAAAPKAVFAGMGLCTSLRLGRGLPLDCLGMLLPAIGIRDRLGARSVVVVIADEHALANGFDLEAVQALASKNERTLRLISSALDLELKIVRASDFHSRERYRSILAEVDRRAPAGDHHYFRMEVADIEYLHRVCGGVLKVGWTISGSESLSRRHDEVAFDQRFKSWMGKHVPFIYCKSGRVLDDSHPKASPYVVTDPARRICLDGDEDVLGKLEAAKAFASADTIKGVRKHLGAIVRGIATRTFLPQGSIEQRLQYLIDTILRPAEVTRAA